MKFDYVAMENRSRLTWDRMPDSVRAMILEAERMGAQVEVYDMSGNWRPAPNNVTRCKFPYRIVDWRAPEDRQEPPRTVRSSDLLALRFRNAIADKEWCVACANGETAKFGGWQANWYARMQEVEQDINDIKAQLSANIPPCVNDRQEPPSSAVIIGRVVEAGNVACLDGRPGLVIETTEAQLRDFGRNVIGCEVEIGARADKE
jgi:hypothetical protein